MLRKAHLPAIYLPHRALPDAVCSQTAHVVWAGETYDPNPQARQYQNLLQERADLRLAGEELLASVGDALSQRQQNGDDAINARLGQIATLIDQHEIRRADERSRAGQDGPAARSVPWAAGPRFAQMFPGAARDTGGFTSFAEFCAGLEAGMWDQRYQASLGGSSNDMGLLIPGQISGELWDMSLEDEVVRPRAKPYAMTSDTLAIPGFTVGGDGAPFGITGGWTPELATIGAVDPDRRALKLTARKLAVITQVGNETIADGVPIPGQSVDQQLSTALPKGIGWKLDQSFLRGDGVGKPVGAISSANPARIVVAKETGQAADTVAYENLANMFGRMHPRHILNSVWVANSGTIPQLLQLSVVVGTGGSHIPVLQNDGQGGFTILTRPVIFTEKVPALGDEGDISLIDFTQYAVGLRADILLEKSGHAGFSTDSTYYRAILRADGQPTWDAPYTPDNGATLSPFVVLGDRA